MKKVKNKLRVVHFPEVDLCRSCFTVEVKDEKQANFVLNTLANQHLWLERNGLIGDYSNAIFVEMKDENDEWVDYWNEEEIMEWDEFVETYLN